MSTASHDKWDVFVSHNCRQKPWVRQAVGQFRDLGLRVFFDEENIEPGDDIVAGIERGLNGSRHVLFVITPSACSSRWVAMETATTLFSDPDASHKRLIPILLEPTAPEQIRLSVKRLRMVDLTNPDERRQNYHQLLRVLNVDGPQLPDPPHWNDDDLFESAPGKDNDDSHAHTAVQTGLSADEITINREFESFSDHDQERLLRAIKEVLDVSGDIRIISRRQGSVKLTLALSPAEAEQLVWAVKAGQLENFDIVDARVVDTHDSGDSVGLSQDEAPSGRESRHPQRIGRYLIQDVLGIGGFGTVYRAFDSALQRNVAIKVLKPAPAHPDRFRREMTTLARIQHPGIVQVLDVGMEDDFCYIVMQYVEGRRLNEWLTESRPSWSDSARVIADVAETLGYVHNQAIIHRDLKPENILLDTTRDGAPRAMIADFGIALTNRPDMTRVAGTPMYAAPEQLCDASVDTRADVWTLGAILLEMLTGKQGERDARVLRAAEHEIPRSIARVCEKALESQPNKRFRDALLFAEALRAALEQSK